jgi:diamine N-acetyltransferase
MPIADIRRASEADVAWLVSQEQRPDFAAFIHRWPAKQHRGNLADADKLYLIAEDETGQRIGFVILAGLRSADRSIELVRMAVTRPGTGLGKKLLASAMQTAFEKLGTNRLWLDVFDDNVRARRLYEALGFREEEANRQAAHKADGQPGILIVMSLRAADYHAAAGRLATPRSQA